MLREMAQRLRYIGKFLCLQPRMIAEIPTKFFAKCWPDNRPHADNATGYQTLSKYAFSKKLPRKWKCFFFIVGHHQFDPYSYNVYVKCTHVQKKSLKYEICYKVFLLKKMRCFCRVVKVVLLRQNLISFHLLPSPSVS